MATKKKSKKKPRKPDLKGFKPLTKRKRKPRKATQARLKREHKRLDDLLKAAASGVKGEYAKLKPTVRTHINADGTIDAEIRINNLPRGVSAGDAFDAIWEYLPYTIADSFISYGIRHEDEAGEESADRHRRGLYWAQTNYQDASVRANMVGNIITAQEKMLGNLRRVRRRKPRDAFVRLHWNIGKKRPQR